VAEDPYWVVVIKPPVMRPNRRYAARIIAREGVTKLCAHNHRSFARAELCARWLARASGARWTVRAE